MGEALAREYAALQEEIHHLAREQEALAARQHALHRTFAVEQTRCDGLVEEWRITAARDATGQEAIARRKEVYLALQACCTEMDCVIEAERAVNARSRALHFEWHAAQRRVQKLRQALDREFFGLHRIGREETAPPPRQDDVDAVALLLHDMRTHLTMATLAADQVCREPRSPRTSRFAPYLMKGLGLLQENMMILDPPLGARMLPPAAPSHAPEGTPIHEREPPG